MLYTIIEDYFPLSNQKGADCSQINTQKIKLLINQNAPLTPFAIKDTLVQHLQFLENGGAGGTWKIIHIKGIVVALYIGVEVEVGKQASFEYQTFPKGIHLEQAILPFSNFCTSVIEDVNFKEGDLSYSVLTDMNAVGANFQETQLAYTDFSRSNLAEANFQNSNLIGADFENCNLTNANFKGANLSRASFRGAKLRNVKI